MTLATVRAYRRGLRAKDGALAAEGAAHAKAGGRRDEGVGNVWRHTDTLRRLIHRGESKMAKKMVLCFDGTWQDSNDNTNVIKIYRSILGEDSSRNQVDETDPPPCAPTIKWYDEGVGNRVLEQGSGPTNWARPCQEYSAGLQIPRRQLR